MPETGNSHHDIGLPEDFNPRDVKTPLVFYAVGLMVGASTIVTLTWSLPAEQRRAFAIIGILLFAAIIGVVTYMGVQHYAKLMGADLQAQVNEARQVCRQAERRVDQAVEALGRLPNLPDEVRLQLTRRE